MAVPLHRIAPITVVLTAGVALSACTSTVSGGSAGVSSEAAAARPAAAAGPDKGAASGTGGSAAGTAVPQPALDAAAIKPRVVRTAQVVVQVDGELAPAAAKVRAVAESLRGTVSSETTTYADTGSPTPAGTPSTGTSGGTAPRAAVRPGESVLVLRVPEPDLDRALTLISGPVGVGRELSRSASAQDVTGDLADLESRVATQRASVARVRALLARATTLQDVVTLEGEVTKRESVLEAAEARRAALADQADLATLTVDLRTKEAAAVVTQQQPNAFLDGLHSGWSAVTASTTVILTVLGALLPVAVVLALAGAPVLWWMRRRRTPAAPLQPGSTSPSPDPGP